MTPSPIIAADLGKTYGFGYRGHRSLQSSRGGTPEDKGQSTFLPLLLYSGSGPANGGSHSEFLRLSAHSVVAGRSTRTFRGTGSPQSDSARPPVEIRARTFEFVAPIPQADLSPPRPCARPSIDARQSDRISAFLLTRPIVRLS